MKYLVALILCAVPASSQIVVSSGTSFSQKQATLKLQQNVSSLLSGRPTITGIPKFINGIQFLDNSILVSSNIVNTVGHASSDVLKSGDTMTGSLIMASPSTITIQGSSFSVGLSTFVITGGNVGIGISTPSAQLEIVSPNEDGVRVTVGGGNNAYKMINAASANKSWVTYPVGNNFVVRESGIADRLTLKAGGNIGIGIANPAYTLDVFGNSNVLSTLTAVSGQFSLNPWIDITAPPYSASPFNIDNSTNIQAAINASPLRGTVYVPCGSFVIFSSITITSSINLVGAGPCSQIRQKSTLDTLSISNVNGMQMRDIFLVSESTVGTTADLHLTGVHRSIFTNVNFAGGDIGVWIQDGILDVFNGLSNGFYLNPSKSSPNTNVIGVYLDRTASAQIGEESDTFINMVLEGCTTGFYLNGYGNHTHWANSIIGGVIESSKGPGLIIDSPLGPMDISGLDNESNNTVIPGSDSFIAANYLTIRNSFWASNGNFSGQSNNTTIENTVVHGGSLVFGTQTYHVQLNNVDISTFNLFDNSPGISVAGNWDDGTVSGGGVGISTIPMWVGINTAYPTMALTVNGGAQIGSGVSVATFTPLGVLNLPSTMNMGTNATAGNILEGGTNSRLILDGDSAGNGAEAILDGSGYGAGAQFVVTASSLNYVSLSNSPRFNVDGTSGQATFYGPISATTIIGAGSGITFSTSEIHSSSVTFSSSVFVGGYADYLGLPSVPVVPIPGITRLSAVTTKGFTRLIQENEGPTTLTLGQDNMYIAKNTSGVSMTPGQVVYVSGQTGNTPIVSLAKADVSTTMPNIGVVTDTIVNNEFGQIMVVGILGNINTSQFSANDQLWVSTTVAGSFINTRPVWPNFVSKVGQVLVSGVGNGSILVVSDPFLGMNESGTNQTNFKIGSSTANINLNSISDSSLFSSLTVKSTITVAGNAFSVGSSSLTVSGGIVTIGMSTFTVGSTFYTRGTYIGVGTANPTKMLEITGSGSSFAGVAGLQMDDTLASSAARNWVIYNGVAATGSLSFRPGTAQGSNPQAGSDILVLSSSTIQIPYMGTPTGKILCLDANGSIGHCVSNSSCLTTCTCTCAAN